MRSYEPSSEGEELTRCGCGCWSSEESELLEDEAGEVDSLIEVESECLRGEIDIEVIKLRLNGVLTNLASLSCLPVPDGYDRITDSVRYEIRGETDEGVVSVCPQLCSLLQCIEIASTESYCNNWSIRSSVRSAGVGQSIEEKSINISDYVDIVLEGQSSDIQ